MAKKRKKLLAKVRGYFENKPAARRLSALPPDPPPGPPWEPPSELPAVGQSVQPAGRPTPKPAVAPPAAHPGQPPGRHPGPLNVQPIPNLEFRVMGDTLRVWRTAEGRPQFDPRPEDVAREFLRWLERTLPAQKFVSVEDLSLLYSAFCSTSWSRQRYPLNPLILTHLGKVTRKQQKVVRSQGKLYRNRVHYFVGPSGSATSQRSGWPRSAARL